METSKAVLRNSSNICNSYKYIRKNLPMACILLKNKTKKQYIKMFSLIKNILNQINRENVIVDYEKNIHEALKKYFPNAIIHECFFYWVQNIINNLKSNGLYKKKKSTKNLNNILAWFNHCRFSSIEKVESYFRILRDLILLHYNDKL